MLSLLNSHRLQTKSRSPVPDPFESEADRAADFVLHRLRAPVLQRKCAGGDSCSCGKCAGEDEEQRLTNTSTRIQRQPKDASRPPAESTAEAKTRQPRSLIVDDEAPSIAPAQMRKSAFLDRLEAEVCATADAELAAVGRSTESCPYIANWLEHYRKQSSVHIERALVKYAPEASTANSANEYFPIVHRRVRQAVANWAKTGKITGVPPGVSMMPPSGGEDKKSEDGFGAGLGKAVSSATKVLFKKLAPSVDPSTDPETVRNQLGTGRALDSHARSRMESAFGEDFSGVRIHTDSHAGSLSSQLNARAFTVGSDVAFASGEYNPGTPVGDALLAHELAHVVQQRGTTAPPGPQKKNASDSTYSSLERDADQSAAHAFTSLWARGVEGLRDVGRFALPRMSSGLRIQRCDFFSSSKDKQEAGKSEPTQTSPTGSSTETGTATPEGGTPPVCTPQSRDCTMSDNPDKIVCEHKADPDTIQKPGDTVNITAKFACNVRSWDSLLEKSDGTSLNLREPATSKTNTFARTWTGKKQFSRIGTFLVDDGEYRHRFDKLLYAYKFVPKTKKEKAKTLDQYATGPGLISNPIKVKARSFSGPAPDHFHYSPDNIGVLGDIIHSEIGIGNPDEKKAIAWAVRNQMIRMNTDKVTAAADFFHDSRKQKTQVDPKDPPDEVKRKSESHNIADEILKKPMSDDTTGGAIKWFSPDSMPKEGESCARVDCRGGLITVQDLAGRPRRVNTPSWSKQMTQVPVPGVRDWRLMLFKL